METAIAAVIILTVFLFAVFTSTLDFFSAQDAMLESWQEMEERTEERARTSITAIGAETDDDGDIVEVTLRSNGNIKLADFDQWDVILQYESVFGSHIEWYGPDEWTYGTYLDAPDVADVFDPGILNPGEEMVIWVSVSPAVKVGSTNLALIGTPNGITASTVFTR